MGSKISCLLLSFCFVINAHCQSQDESNPKHDVGFNINIILQNVFNSSTSPLSLMYKKYTSEKKAWGFGLNTSLSVVNPTQNSGNGNNTVYVYTSNVNVSLSAGKEAQQFITNKWVWYYGGDILLSYASSTIDRYQATDVKIQSSSAGTSGLTARPFLGMRFNITKQLYVSTEFSINLGYAEMKRHDEDFTNNTVSDSKNSIYTLGFAPASSLFVFYRF